jgi:hypothetical protein
MRDARQSRRITSSEPPRHLRRSALLAGAMLGPLVLAGTAFGQTERRGVDEAAAVDEETAIRVPEGFEAKVYADNLGRARHIAVRDDGDIYVMLRERVDGQGRRR